MSAADRASAPSSHLPPVEQTLQDRVQPLLAPGERILAAAIINKGPRPGIDGCVWPLFMGPLIALTAWLMVALGVQRARRFWTVVVTDRGLLLFANQRADRPHLIAARFDNLEPLGPINDEGHPWLEIAGTRYWLEDPWWGQLQRLRALKHQRA